MPVVLDVKDLVSTHLAIIASTGAGKSYLASVIIEELMRPYNGAAVLMIDPHGEYSTLEEMANHAEFADASEPRQPQRRAPPPTLSGATRVYLHDQVKVRLSTLTLGDLRYLLPSMTDKQHHFLGRAYDALHQDKKGAALDGGRTEGAMSATSGAEANDESGDDSGNSTVAALHWKIDERLWREQHGLRPTSSIWSCARCSSRGSAPCCNSTRWTSATSR